MRDAAIAKLSQCAADDELVVLLSGDLGFKVLDEFRGRFPKQFFNLGVAEQNMANVACGMALEGYKVFIYSIGNFVALRCLEQLRNGAAYHGVNVTAVSIGAGFTYGALGVSHHATEDMAILRAIPETDVVSPGDDLEAAAAVEHLYKRERFSYLRLETAPSARTQRAGLPTACSASITDAPFSFGKARLLLSGTDVTLVTIGGIVGEACAAAELLQDQGISAQVLHYHALAPFDSVALIASAQAGGGIITIEEHSIDGGLGSAAAECLLEAGVQTPFFKRLGIRSQFTRVVGSQQYLRSLHRLDAASIADEASALCAKLVDGQIRMVQGT